MKFKRTRQCVLWHLRKAKPIWEVFGWGTLAVLFGGEIASLCGLVPHQIFEKVFIGAFIFLWVLVLIIRGKDYLEKLKEEEEMEEQAKGLTLGEYQRTGI